MEMNQFPQLFRDGIPEHFMEGASRLKTNAHWSVTRRSIYGPMSIGFYAQDAAHSMKCSGIPSQMK